MRYIRKHQQQNLIKEDTCKGKPDLLKNRLDPEVFDNVEYFKIKTTQDTEFACWEGDPNNIGDIIEGHAQFSFVTKDKKKITSVRYDWVMSFEFQLFQ